MGAPMVAGWIAHITFWTLLVVGAWSQDLGPKLLATFLVRAATVFQDDERRADDQARSSAELERLVGRLTMEAEVLKKASTLLDAAWIRNGRRP